MTSEATGAGNPLLELHTVHSRSPNAAAVRDDAIARYAFAIPTEEALARIAAESPDGVIEIGAGTGYWAHMLTLRGVDVIATDPDPPPSTTNPWFRDIEPHTQIVEADGSIAAEHPRRTLLVCWPVKNRSWATSSVRGYRAAGGERVIYIGDVPGGRTGDDSLHALLGELDSCVQHRYGVLDAPCICDVDAEWTHVATVELPHWPDHDDDLRIYRPRHAPDAGATSQRWWHFRRR